MNKKLSTYIFVHDQEIILDFVDRNRFSEFENLKYVFLSNRPSNKIENMTNVIICNKLEKNIEQYPKFTSFTGWYALIENNLIDSDYVNFFEYDLNYVDGITDIINELIGRDFDFVGYFPMSIKDPVYVQHKQYSTELIESVKKKTGKDILSMINELITQNPSLVWSSSSNSTWKVTKLKEYINWFNQFVDDVKISNYCGHIHERSLSFFYFLNNLKVTNTRGLMSHLQLNTHGTSPLPEDRFNKLYQTLK